MYDVGGRTDRLLANARTLNEANVIIVVAGMEGALASVVGGLVDKPGIAVRQVLGMAQILAVFRLCCMLNSCASGGPLSILITALAPDIWPVP